jgi:predicted aspartyl protease
MAVAAEEPAEEPLYAAPTGLDRVGRVLAAVSINGRGPFRFIVDTGSNRSAISNRLAATLQLAMTAGPAIEVHGVTGSAVVPAVRIARMQIGEIVLTDQLLPLLPDAVFADADGILGVEGLQGAMLDVDFKQDRVTIRRSTGRRAGDGYLIVPAWISSDGLLLVKGRVGSVRSRIILDTGAERTIGNIALQRALEAVSRRGEVSMATVTGATPGSVGAVAFLSPAISIGDARMQNVPVTFADLHVFAVRGLLDAPALVIGMDVLGTVDRFVVDYRRREFQLRPPNPDGVGVRNCNTGACGTRLPRSR